MRPCQRLRELGAKHSALLRYEQTLRHLGEVRGPVLDVGGPSALRAYLLEQGVEVVGTEPHDVRRVMPFGDSEFALVLCTEVLEHLRDLEESPLDAWCFSGALGCLRELRRVGRELLLSTPNVCSWRAVKRLLNARHPHEYVPHVREYAPREVRDLLQQTGWVEQQLWTEDCWGGVPHGFEKRLTVVCNRSSMRGDVIYARAV